MIEINHESMMQLLKSIEETICCVNNILSLKDMPKEDRVFFLVRRTNHQYCAQLIREILLGEYEDDEDMLNKLGKCMALYSEDSCKLKKRFEFDEEE